MARTQPETLIVNRIRKSIERTGGKTVKLHGSPLLSNEPDIVGVHHGVCFAIEVKQPDEEPPLGQRIALLQWRAAGAQAGVAENVDDAWDIIITGENRHEHYLKNLD